MGGSGSTCSCHRPPARLTRLREAAAEERDEDETEAFIAPEREAKCSLAPEETSAVDDSPGPDVLRPPRDGSPQDGLAWDGPPWDVPQPVSRLLLDFAQKLSQDVVAQALLLCWQVQVRLGELPFIDSEGDYVI